MLDVVTISFSVRAFDDESARGIYAVVPVAGDARLQDLVAAFERDQHFEPAGGYAGVDLFQPA
jgi:hypothetical protein